MHYIFYGSEGSGKTTQGKLLAQKLNIPHLVSGDLVRRMAQKDQGIMGDICREALALGHYVADTEMFVLWKARLKEPDCQNGWVIDGFPRNITQVMFLEDKLEKYGQKIDKVFYLKVSEAEAITRLLKRGRRSPDGSLHDDPERIKERLRRYKEKEREVLDFYRDKGVLTEVNGERTIEEIHEDILSQAKKQL